MKQTKDVAELQGIAKRIRREIVEMIGEAKSGPSGRIALRG